MLPAARYADLKIIGQVASTYLLTESEQGLVIIDQHAAHERIMFERFRARKPESVAQPLLIPHSISLSFAEMELLADHLNELAKLGVEAEIFGKDTVII